MHSRRVPVLALAALTLALAASPAEAAPQTTKIAKLEQREARQERTVAASRQTLRFFERRPRLLYAGPLSRRAKAWRIVRFHRGRVEWTMRELAETRQALRPLREATLSVYERARDEALRNSVSMREWDGCLAPLISRENANPPESWNPQRWNGAGSGAYGLPQALPGAKMASEGPDWRTNPRTQVRWMLGYLRGRYGSVCAGDAFQRARGWY